MNDEDAKALGMRAKALPGFSWQPKMSNGLTGLDFLGIDNEDASYVLWLDGDGCISPLEPDEDDWPDFRDPPTYGWLLHLAIEATGEYIEVWLDVSCGFKAHVWKGPEMRTLDNNGDGGYTSEIEAWIAVLEDAAKR